MASGLNFVIIMIKIAELNLGATFAYNAAIFDFDFGKNLIMERRNIITAQTNFLLINWLVDRFNN